MAKDHTVCLLLYTLDMNTNNNNNKSQTICEKWQGGKLEFLKSTWKGKSHPPRGGRVKLNLYNELKVAGKSR